MAWAERIGMMVLHVFFFLLVLRQAASVTTPPVQECETKVIVCEWQSTEINCGEGLINICTAVYGRTDRTTCPPPVLDTTCGVDVVAVLGPDCNGNSQCTISANNGLSGDPCQKTHKYLEVAYTCKDTSSAGSISPVIPAVVVVIFVVLIVVVSGVICYKRRLKHGSSQGIVASGEPRESPGIRDNPTFESLNVQDLRVTDVAGYHSGNDPYMALTTPHDGPTFQKYETLSKVISQEDGYEVPVNKADGQTGPEYGKTLYKLQVHPETDYEITHEYQDPGVVGANIPQYESHIDGLQEMSKTDYEAIHEYEDPGIIG